MIPPAGSYLSPRTAQAVLSRALVRQLGLKHRQRCATVPDLDNLRFVPTRALEARGSVVGDVAFVRSLDLSFEWDPFGRESNDPPRIVRPDDVPAAAPGRWRAAPFRDFHREFFLRHVQLCHNGLRTKDLLELCAGQLPALFVSFAGDGPEEQSQIPGTLFWNNYSFRLRAISANWRGEPAAELGSPDEKELAEDPGADSILGRCSWFLSKYNDLNNTVGVSRIMIGSTRPVEAWGNERRLVSELSVMIHASLWVPNEPQDLVRPTRALVQRQVQDEQGAWQNLGPVDEVPL